MNRTNRSKSDSGRRIRRTHVALAALQLVLALFALRIDLSALCGACEATTSLHFTIAAAGAAAYAALLGAGLLGAKRTFYKGVFIACGIHLALGIWLVRTESFCPPCIASAAVAVLLAGLSFVFPVVERRLAWRAFVSAFVLGLIGTTVLQGMEEDRKAEASRAIQEIHVRKTVRESSRSSTALRITVFEMAHCGYCRDFRDSYFPRLKRDFGRDVDVSFQPARTAAWVRRTPTIVIENGPVFEGLPLRYEDLHRAVVEGLNTRNL